MGGWYLWKITKSTILSFDRQVEKHFFLINLKYFNDKTYRIFNTLNTDFL